MIEQQIRTWNVLDEKILNLFRINLREDYVPDEYQALAFADIEIPIGSGATMLPPKLEAKILEELKNLLPTLQVFLICFKLIP